MNATKRRAIFETLQSLNPHPTTELEYSTPFELLIAVMLSAQATDVSVNKATRRMFPVAHTPQQFVELGEEGVAEYIRTIGLYRTKAKNVVATSRILLEQYGGEVPREGAQGSAEGPGLGGPGPRAQGARAQATRARREAAGEARGPQEGRGPRRAQGQAEAGEAEEPGEGEGEGRGDRQG